jgi:hypothetical protein
MSRIVRLTEKDLSRLVKKVIQEQAYKVAGRPWYDNQGNLRGAEERLEGGGMYADTSLLYKNGEPSGGYPKKLKFANGGPLRDANGDFIAINTAGGNDAQKWNQFKTKINQTLASVPANKRGAQQTVSVANNLKNTLFGQV